MRYLRWLLGAMITVAAAAAAAQGADESFVLKHPWVVPPPNAKPEAYFLDLKDGDRIETPYVVRFGLSGRGLSPSEVPAGKAGHHHLLIDFPIPKDMKVALPFTDHYIHFGKGEMQTVLELKPGTYQLALLLADDNHVPYPVYSKPIRVTVTKYNPDVNIWRMLGDPRVEIRAPANGATVHGPFRVNFHASGYNVATAQSKMLDGWFRLNVEPRGKAAEVLDFTRGQTEVWLNPPKGEYTLRLQFMSNLHPGKLFAEAPPVRVNVAGAK